MTLLFSREQYLAAAEAYLRGIERRIAAGLDTNVGSVASVFISRWDVAVTSKVPDTLRDQLGIAIAKRTYKAYCELLASPRWQAIVEGGFNPQRLLWASTGTKDPKASDMLYIKSLAAPNTVNTMPEGTLKALADHGEIGGVMPADGGDCEQVLAEFAKAGVDDRRLGSAASNRRRKVVRQFLERTDGGDQVQERRPARRVCLHEGSCRGCRRYTCQDSRYRTD